ncbi:unnamed protein product, partial [Larinioides sclopetarius]
QYGYFTSQSYLTGLRSSYAQSYPDICLYLLLVPGVIFKTSKHGDVLHLEVGSRFENYVSLENAIKEYEIINNVFERENPEQYFE